MKTCDLVIHITAVQEPFLENGVSTLAINLSLGLNDRHGPYDCTTPHP